MNKETTLNTTECVEEVMENCEVSEKLGKKIARKSAIGLCVLAIAGVITTAVRRHRGKIEDLMVEKLKKKGYTVLMPLDDLDDEEEVNEDQE